MYDKYQLPMPSDASSGCGRTISSKSTKKSHYSLSHTINFLDNWLQLFDANYHNRTAFYKSKMSELFKKKTKIISSKKAVFLS